MRTLLRAIASALRSWLNSLRGASTATQSKGQVQKDLAGDTSYEKAADVAPAAAQPITDARATGRFSQVTEPATDEDDDLRDSDVLEETAVVSGQVQRLSDLGECTHQGQEAVADSVTQPYEETAAKEQETEDAVEAASLARPLEKMVGDDLDRVGDLAQLAEVATDEGDDVRTDDTSEETGVVPGQAQEVSDRGGCKFPGQEAIAGSADAPYEEPGQAAGEQETEDAVEAVSPAQPSLGKMVADDVDDHIGDLAQLAEVAIDEGDDVGADDASEETGVVPGQAQEVSERGGWKRQGQEALAPLAGSADAPYQEPYQVAEEQEAEATVEAVSPVEHLAELLVDDRDDHIGRQAREDEVTSAPDGGGRVDAAAINSGAKSQRSGTRPPPTATGENERRRPPQYRAPAGGPRSRQRSSQPPARGQGEDRPPARAGRAAIHVRVIFQHGGDCIVSLLPQRLPELPEELVVSSEGGDVALFALQDEWYQDVVSDNIADILREGIVWKESETGQEWLLSGREVFVLAERNTHRGFVSCHRLTLGRNHVVPLCTATQLSLVEDVLYAAGCANWSQFRESDGVPSGWRVLREVVPQKPVPLSNEADILNILRPRPEIEVTLEGGIRLAYSTWLLGFPPAIHIYGASEHNETVLIDGQEASVSEEDGYTAPGWDIEGEHQVFCGSSNRSYSLARSQDNWIYWPAYSFPVSSSRGGYLKFEFCGPLVRPVAIDGRTDHRQVVPALSTNPVLIGAGPGEVFFAHSRLDLRGARCFGLPAFDPVWALPREPLRCDKRRNRILLVGEPTAAGSRANAEPVGNRRDLKPWCRLILDASRKGLSVAPASATTDDVWREYKHLARSLWRRFR